MGSLANRLPRSATWWSDGSTLTSLLGVWPVIADCILAETEFRELGIAPPVRPHSHAQNRMIRVSLTS